MFLFNWFWWPDPAPARNLPAGHNVKSCPILLTRAEVVSQLNALRKVPPPQPRTDFEPSPLQAALTQQWTALQRKRIAVTQ